MHRQVLRDDKWERIKDLLPGKPGDRGVSAKNNRLFLEAVLWMRWAILFACLLRKVRHRSMVRQMRLLRDFRLTLLWPDKGYDSDAFIEKVNAGGAVAVIPGRKNRVTERDYDKTIYKERHLVERLFQTLKHYRRIATRYERLARNYMAMLSLVAIIIWLA